MEQNPYPCAPFHKYLGAAHSETIVRRLENIASGDLNRELGAVILPTGGVMRVENVADDPSRDFVMPRPVIAKLPPGAVIWHSHPHGPAYPSVQDQLRQMQGSHGWAISARDPATDTWQFMCWGDQLPKAKLVGRSFIHFIWDCYSIVRDWYALTGRIIPDFTRKADWWADPDSENVIMRNMEAGGFKFHEKEGFIPRTGDVAVMSIASRAKVKNHLAVLQHDSSFIHHVTNRLSAHDPAEDWMKYVQGWARYEA